MVKTFRLEEFGIEVELGKYARQADGAVWLKQGGTVVLSTVVVASSEVFPGFLPLTIEYREYFSAAGRIPGGYYKREGRLSDNEILTSRLIDRSIRPLFPVSFFDQVQIISTVYSADKDHTPGPLALLASSLALVLSGAPFLGPIGVVEIGRVDGQWVFNPLHPQMQKSDVRLIIAGTDEGICMVEGSANEISEQDFIDLLFRAHAEIKKVVAWQLSIAKEMGVVLTADTYASKYDWNAWVSHAQEFLTHARIESAFIADKVLRNDYLEQINQEFVDLHKELIEGTTISTKVVEYIFEQELQKKISDLIIQKKTRIDDRNLDQVRQITVEVGLLPQTHGSALFTRGRTQALVTTTLGGGQDEQRFESIMNSEDQSRSFMLHYNFPPFSVGEARALRGPSRREIGHGFLAATSFKYLLPDKESFPYTIRIVADMLESDGSTSMATACGTTMSLMQAGVPIKNMVSGIAMGLLKSTTGTEFCVLSDISGFEDAFGLMDFKVVGTDKGITAIQMDIKYKGGLSREVFEQALEQARQGRLFIRGEMQKVMDKPNPELSVLVPKVVTFMVETDKIGAIIGSGGKTIREIIDVTKTSIDIEDDGLVKIFGGPEADIKKAVNWVKTLAGMINRGDKFMSKIRRFAEFGMFMELVPGLDGLAHISNIPKALQRTFSTHYTMGQELLVEVVEYDKVTGRIGLRIIEDAK